MWGLGGKDDWERRCLDRARRGDRAAFAELYEAYAPRLYREVLLPRLGNRTAAEDALSETFRMLLEKIDTLEHKGGGLWSWLATVATNKANDMFRVKTRTGRALASFEQLLAPLRAAREAELGLERDRALIRTAVQRALEALNPRYRQAIELRFYNDESRESCASALEVTVATFDVLLCRALKSFRKEWAKIQDAERVAT